jgi:hypothetical protein
VPVLADPRQADHQLLGEAGLTGRVPAFEVEGLRPVRAGEEAVDERGHLRLAVEHRAAGEGPGHVGVEEGVEARPAIADG